MESRILWRSLTSALRAETRVIGHHVGYRYRRARGDVLRASERVDRFRDRRLNERGGRFEDRSIARR